MEVAGALGSSKEGLISEQWERLHERNWSKSHLKVQLLV